MMPPLNLGENDPAEQAKKMLEQIATNFEQLGRQWKLMYDGLIKVGFNDQQALAILIGFIQSTVKK